MSMPINILKSSPDGNAFCIMGMVRSYLHQTGRAHEWPSVLVRMQQDDYDHLCRVTEEVTDGLIQIVEI
jgi:hypothetical protein